MTLEERMEKMEAAYGTQSQLMRELRDAVTVTATLEARRHVSGIGEFMRRGDAPVHE